MRFEDVLIPVGLFGILLESHYGTTGSQSYFRRGIRLATLTRAAKPDVDLGELMPLRDKHPLTKLRVRPLSEHEWALFTVAGWFSRGTVSAIRGHLALDERRAEVSLVVYLNYWVVGWPLAIATVGGHGDGGMLVMVIGLAVVVGVSQFSRFLGVLRKASRVIEG